MRKKRKKRNIGMTEGAKNAMEKYSNEVKSGCRKIFRDPYDATLESVSTRFAKEGFKKGYDVGRREERAKVFNLQERIQAFRDEMEPICKKYGIVFLNDHVDIEVSGGTIKFKEQFAGSFHDMMDAYVKEMIAPLPSE